MPSKHQRVFTLSTNEQRRLYRWDGATLHEGVNVDYAFAEQFTADFDRDLVAVSANSGTVTLYPGAISGELGEQRNFRAPAAEERSDWAAFESFVLADGYFFAATTDRCPVVSLDLHSPNASFVELSAPLVVPPERGANSSLIAIDGQLLVLDYVADQISWRVFDAPNPRAMRPKTTVKLAVPKAHWVSQLSQLCPSASGFMVLSDSIGHHTQFARVTVFDRRTLERMFTVECPMLYTRGTLNYPDPYYQHVDAWDEQLLVCEHNRGIGILRDDSLNSLRAQTKDGILDPATLHKAMRWIAHENATIQSAFFCGSASVAAVWKDKTTQREFFTQLTLSDL